MADKTARQLCTKLVTTVTIHNRNPAFACISRVYTSIFRRQYHW